MVTTLEVDQAPVEPAWRSERPTNNKSPVLAFFSRRRRSLLGILGALLVLGSWQLCGQLNIVNSLYASYPTQIAAGFKSFFVTEGGLHAMQVSGTEFGIGFLLALVIGMVAGLAMGWWSWLEYLFDPVVNFCYAVPRIALVPLLVIWFGIGTSSKVAVVFITAVFPILINTMSGVKTVDATLIQVGRSFNANRRQLFRTVILPGAVPSIVTGIRLGIGIGLIGMVVGELIASTAGLGYDIERAGTTLNTPLMFDAVIIIAVAGVVLTQLLRMLERRADRWRPQVGA